MMSRSFDLFPEASRQGQEGYPYRAGVHEEAPDQLTGEGAVRVQVVSPSSASRFSFSWRR